MLIRQGDGTLSWQDIGAHEFIEPNPYGNSQRKGGKKRIDQAVFSRGRANQNSDQDSQSESHAKRDNC
jgi:hypothetical protein